MENAALWDLVFEAGRAIAPTYEPLFDDFYQAAGLDPWALGLLMAALSFEPERTTPARLQVRGPYTAASAYLERLRVSVKPGYLVEIAEAEFKLTDLGRSEVERIMAEGRAAMAEADPLPPSDSRRFAGLLDRVVTTCREAPSPPGKWSIRHCEKLMPPRTPPLPFSEQAISCLAAYRDDSHLAAWQGRGVSAAALEALTLLWRGEADSLDGVSQRLARRGHPQAVYAEALADLRGLAFVAGPDHAPRLTDAGRDFREQVEALTDAYFFAPWVCFDDLEKAELATLLRSLRDGLP